jgi:hypothetical protein
VSYPPPPPPLPPPGPPGKKPWGALAVAIVGSGLITVALAMSMGVILGLLFWQMLANVVMVVFVQELRWYGPGIFEAADGDLWQWVFGLGLGGTVLVGIAGMMLARTNTPFPRPRRTRPAGR